MLPLRALRDGQSLTISHLRKEGGMLEIVAYGILGGMILAASLVVWWFVRLVE
jgi:hypothetical protein